MILLAIDPGSNKCGVALFENGVLKITRTLTTDGTTPLKRRLDIARQLDSWISSAAEIASEEPFLIGRNNNGMQRLLGMIEKLSFGRTAFYHPMTVKKVMAAGSADKFDVALAAGERLNSDLEKELLADAVAREAWDETDAVAIGLTHLGGINEVKLPETKD